ncbi:MAG: Asp/Glu racemase [Rhodospirillales bacterium]|jgi:allantoin racemase|nr:Asp/Glu racemase [Rhodospirillales bacterium]
MSGRILVINPNSTQAVAGHLDEALAPLGVPGGPVIECISLADGPPGIETQAHIESVVQPISRTIKEREDDVDAFVIACYSDPGLQAAREATKRRVFGIAECGMLSALTLGERFGVISILAGSIPRHLRYVRALGLNDRFAGDMAIGLGVVELSDDAKVLERMIAVGKRLRDECGAHSAVMGCAGMARFKARVEEAVGIPVVEPTQAAVTMAMGAVLLAAN